MAPRDRADVSVSEGSQGTSRPPWASAGQRLPVSRAAGTDASAAPDLVRGSGGAIAAAGRGPRQRVRARSPKPLTLAGGAGDFRRPAIDDKAAYRIGKAPVTTAAGVDVR